MTETGPEGAADKSTPPPAPAWDPVIRLTHWCVAFAVVLNGLIVEDESLIHIWIGYAAIACLLLRFFWGVIGTDEARFTSFPPSIAAAKTHLADLLAGRHKTYRSHNPIGTWMVYALWGLLIVVSVTGLMMESEPFPPHADSAFQGFLSLFQEYERGHGHGVDKVVEEIHEVAANMVLFLAMIHVGGVFLEQRLSGTRLMRAMISGEKRARPTE